MDSYCDIEWGISCRNLLPLPLVNYQTLTIEAFLLLVSIFTAAAAVTIAIAKIAFELKAAVAVIIAIATVATNARKHSAVQWFSKLDFIEQLFDYINVHSPLYHELHRHTFLLLHHHHFLPKNLNLDHQICRDFHDMHFSY